MFFNCCFGGKCDIFNINKLILFFVNLKNSLLSVVEPSVQIIFISFFIYPISKIFRDCLLKNIIKILLIIFLKINNFIKEKGSLNG